MSNSRKFKMTDKDTNGGQDNLIDRVNALRDTKLISEAEKKAVILSRRTEETKLGLFDLLIEKDEGTSHQMLAILRSKQKMQTQIAKHPRVATRLDSSGRSTSRKTFESTKNPLEIAVIIRAVFEFLDLADIRNCRQVSREWNHVAEPLLRTLIQIRIGYSEDNKSFNRTNDKFNDVFTQTNIPFTALCLKKFPGNSSSWPASNLQEVFDRWGNNLKELFIDGIRIKNALNSFNISSLFTGLSLTKLKVHPYKKSRLQFSLDMILNVQHLELVDCDLNIPVGCKIAPIEVKMHSSIIIFEDECIGRIINHFVDFGNVKSFSYIASKNEATQWPKRMKLNMEGNYQLDYLQLSGASVFNWSKSNWAVDKIEFAQTEFSGNSNITVREMVITNPYISSKTHIPENVDSLTCVNVDFSDLVVPMNIRKLRFEKVLKGPFCNHTYVYAETVILSNVSYQNFVTVVKKVFSPNYIWLIPKRVQLSINKILPCLDRIQNTRIVIARIKWEGVNFRRSQIRPYVDKKSESYVFENKRGRAIPIEEFEEMMK